MSVAKTYTAKDITVLEGLEPVRKRPAMYIGSTDVRGLHHLAWEVLDNAVDEALNGFCTDIKMVIENDGGITVTDNGRGIPVDIHPKTKRPAIETILCTLHAGGKFDHGAYKSSGGLHGVGASVVNALSEVFIATVWRDGYEWAQEFSRGKPKGNLKKGKPSKAHGTEIYFKPDSAIFSKTHYNFKTIVGVAESKAFLNKGLKITVADKLGDEKAVTFKYENGIKDYIARIVQGVSLVNPEPFYFEKEDEFKVECAMHWTTATDTEIHSYANSINTTDGGTHELAVRSGLTKAVRAYAERKNLIPKNIKAIAPEDVYEGLYGIVSVLIKNPQFQGQTKEKLNNPEISSPIESSVKNGCEAYLLANPTMADAVVKRVLLAAEARLASRAAKDSVTRKLSSLKLNLPGKLADCSSNKVEDTELFIVEGDSAGGSAKMARDRKTQAVLSLRGKILNVEQVASLERIQANNEIKNLLATLGCGVGQHMDVNKLRYGRVILMTDADVDGAHISVLLLTFIYRYMPELINKGHVFLAMPPLYRIEAGKEVFYAMDEMEKEKILAKLNGRKYDVGRFKGLGEMNPETLKETTMNPKSRSLMKVQVLDHKATNDVFERLMGKDPKPRFLFIKERAEFAELDI
ncbi:MAG: DNA topoisomerase IV subunit B [Nitrospirae bacterium GWC2_57_13]|jgi:DNA gyrase subunit B|nr:MAG: DNA topoisomerase IV subunit B [Nitrospirae bacterium GWC1_57_7]OGW27005.1 MAG: DNA topoisomerase IV subunit B [Nitrospirae bacterium GWC2_57_13]OGW44243.1 MAG: DNA topoisomerase IV subunit B [Nitrospirae bacterium GWD2_57_8]HAS52802.1 DNA topoisomerase IV subunit B [Nitrospiraceae bacterium]